MSAYSPRVSRMLAPNERNQIMNRQYQIAVEHIVGLGFDESTAADIVGMDLDCSFEKHVEYILNCDAAEISAWIGIGGVA